MRNGVFWDVTLGRTNVSEEFSASFIRVTSVRQLLVTASVVPSSPILVTLMKEALSSSERSVLTRGTRRDISEDTILQSCPSSAQSTTDPTWLGQCSNPDRQDGNPATKHLSYRMA
jgi:hypothetical protein